MWSKPTWLMLAAMAVVISGCGFEPLNARRTGSQTVADTIADIRVAPVPDRIGQIFRTYLESRLHPQGAPPRPIFELRAGLTEQRRELAVRADEVATRVNLTMIARFQLVRLADGRVVFNDFARVTNGYNKLRSDYATLSAAEDAQRRAVQELAEEIRSRIAIYLGGTRRGP